ncbi:ADP-ribosyltransferase [Pseudoalteromonas aurantia]|uniref:ADP ribosyltransferase domain-containing protein n=1 Tax=Pseudoalteromonas aurantia 208 TaxID=1314867 RepID=A0ABR9EC31_9GAMM|nr:ADP-ribosyltransferase [Pseudoalteromonas aurantia]MBE0368561.1 hypothetical protein [Pseudoalteromonas aurantia 208]
MFTKTNLFALSIFASSLCYAAPPFTDDGSLKQFFDLKGSELTWKTVTIDGFTDEVPVAPHAQRYYQDRLKHITDRSFKAWDMKEIERRKRISELDELAEQGKLSPGEAFERASLRGVGKEVLTRNEVQAIKEYTDSSSPHIEDILADKLTDRVNTLDNALDHIPANKDITYRGAAAEPQQYGENIQVGDHIQSRTFMSTTADPAYAKSYSERMANSGDKDAIFFRVDGETGRDISMYSVYTGDSIEAEVLYPRNSVFQVTNIEKSNGITYVNLQEKPSYKGHVKDVYSGKTYERKPPALDNPEIEGAYCIGL